MDVLALILACSVYPDDHLVRAMVDLASQGNVYFVGDLATLMTFDHTGTLADAERLVGELEHQGGRPVVGLMGVPQEWATRFGRSPRDLLDACTNIWVGTAVLAKHMESCLAEHTVAPPGPDAPGSRTRVAPPEAIRSCTLDRFGADLGVSGFTEAVLRYLPQQRVLYAPMPFAGTSAQGPICRCDTAPDKPKPKAAPPKPAPAPARPSNDDDELGIHQIPPPARAPILD